MDTYLKNKILRLTQTFNRLSDQKVNTNLIKITTALIIVHHGAVSDNREKI